MSSKPLTPIGEVLDETLQLSLEEIADRLTIHTTVIVEMVQIGVLEPKHRDPAQWHFDGYDLLRLRRALRLQQDLGINQAGLALCIDLQEQVAELRARIRALEGIS